MTVAARFIIPKVSLFMSYIFEATPIWSHGDAFCCGLTLGPYQADL